MEHSSLTAEDFWDFSIKVYGKNPIQNTCLQCQDHYGADVNLLLLGVYLDCRGISVSEATYAALLKVSNHWQAERLGPLRQQRRAAPKGSEEYKRLLSEELETEKKEQAALMKALHEGQTNHSQPTELLHSYVKHLGLPGEVSVIFTHAQTQ